MEGTIEELIELLQQYRKFVDPIVRFTFNITNTTAVERLDITKELLFMLRGPNTAPGALSAGLQEWTG